MTNLEVDLAILRYTLVARDYRANKRDLYVLARCKPNTLPRGVYQYEAIEKHVNLCTADEH